MKTHLRHLHPTPITQLVVGGVLAVAFTLAASAAQVTDRSVSISSAEPGVAVNYTFNFSVPSATPIRGLQVEVCTTSEGACTAPAGFDSGNATLLNQPIGFGESSGWNVDTDDNTQLAMRHTSNTTAPDSAQSVTFGNVINPTTPNQSFYLRIATYADANYTTPIDDGVVVTATTEGLIIHGLVPPILTFCLGVTIPSDCASATGTMIDLGIFSPNTTAAATSQMRASTNAGDGYVITVTGTTLASGANTIPAISAQATSQVGTSQFGINLRNNTIPNAGSDVAGAGAGTAASGYSTVNQFQFNSGEIVASAPGPTDNNTYTTTYITNIAPFQAAGSYTTTVTYVATATF